MLDEAHITTLRLLGHTYWRMGYLDKAERLFKALLALLPGDGQGLRQLAAVALAGGRAEEALEYLNRLDEARGAEGGRDRTALLMKAQALWRQGRAEEARAAFNDYLAGEAAGGGAT